MTKPTITKAAMYYSNQDIRIQGMPLPDIQQDEVLMRVESSGICGSDVMEWYRRNKVPLVLGHEVSGIVEQTGAQVTAFKKGDRIAAFHHVPCGNCHYCVSGHPTVCDALRKTNFSPGGFSEYILLHNIHVEKGMLKLPDDVSFDEATFIEPLACVLRAQRIAGVDPKHHHTVAVLGSGISGILHIKALKGHGVKNVIATDVIPYRLKMASQCGADTAVDAKDISGIGKADLVIVCAGAPSVFEQALRIIDRGGTILIFSAAGEGYTLSLPINEVFWKNEVTITSSYAASPNDSAEALDWIAHKKITVSDMITHHLPLNEIVKGFQLVVSGKESMKVIIKM